MRPHIAATWLVVALAASTGCNSGGTTGDFTGGSADPVDCPAARFEGEGDEPALGFSMTDILAATEGRFDVPVRWTSPCEEDDSRPGCDRAAEFVETWAGTETTVHVEIRSDGSKAEVRHPTEEDPVCAQGMFIPVEFGLESDDGLLDETVDATVWSQCGTDSSVSLVSPVEGVGGATAVDLPPAWSLEVSVGFYTDRMWFGAYVGPAGSGAVLSTDLPPFGERTHDVPRSSVELQAGATLPDDRESSCKTLL